MNGNTELLNFVFQNSEMGVNTIQQILGILEDNRIEPQMREQLTQYQAIHQEAKELLNRHGHDEKGINSFDRVKTYLMVNMQTMNDRSCSHIAEMLVVGSTMGVVEATRKLREYSDGSPEILGLMQRLLAFEEQNIKRLKEYL